jgi:hypothetical protein
MDRHLPWSLIFENIWLCCLSSYPWRKAKEGWSQKLQYIFIGYSEPTGIKVFFNRDVLFSEDNLIHSNSSTLSSNLRSVSNFQSSSTRINIMPDPPDHSTSNLALGPQLKAESPLYEFFTRWKPYPFWHKLTQFPTWYNTFWHKFF